MIVCQCNVLSDKAILERARSPVDAPRSPAQVYRCMGCSPNCGKCVKTIRALLKQAQAGACAVGCGTCPAGANHDHAANEDADLALVVAAE